MGPDPLLQVLALGIGALDLNSAWTNYHDYERTVGMWAQNQGYGFIVELGGQKQKVDDLWNGYEGQGENSLQAFPEAQPAELSVEVPENYGGNFPLYLIKVSLRAG